MNKNKKYEIITKYLHLNEIENNNSLKWFLGFTILVFHQILFEWQRNFSLNLEFMNKYSYFSNIIYMIIFTLLIINLYLIWEKKITNLIIYISIILIDLFIISIALIYKINYYLFNYITIFFIISTLILIFLKNKYYLLKILSSLITVIFFIKNFQFNNYLEIFLIIIIISLGISLIKFKKNIYKLSLILFSLGFLIIGIFEGYNYILFPFGMFLIFNFINKDYKD